MFDFDLAELYRVPTFRFNQAVKRNFPRFPEDFMFQLTNEELENWRSQIVISNPGARIGLRRPPYVGYLITMVASDIKGLDKKVKKQFKRLLRERSSKQKIGFRTE